MNNNCQYCVNKPRQANFIIDNNNYVCKSCIDSTILQNIWKANNYKIEYIQSKQVNRYNLPLDHRYKIIGFDYTGSILDGGGTTCDNCNRIIVNTATVETEEGKRYTVGLDCAETLSLVDCSDFWKIKEQEAHFRKISGYIKNIKKAMHEGKKVSYETTDYCTFIYFYSQIYYRFNTETFNQYFKLLNLPLHE